MWAFFVGPIGCRWLHVALERQTETGRFHSPRYPLYTAVGGLLNIHPAPYYLDEANGWQLKMSELTRAVTEARARGITVKALVVIVRLTFEIHSVSPDQPFRGESLQCSQVVSA
jgi:hypothetical protein